MKRAMPAVEVPTLRQSTVISGKGLLRTAAEEIIFDEAQPANFDDSDTVFIDDLVAGVQSCNAAAAAAGDRLRRERTAPQREMSTPRSGRSRTPVPILERKPWGANAPSTTPRRKASPAQPRTETKETETPVEAKMERKPAVPRFMNVVKPQMASEVESPSSVRRERKPMHTPRHHVDPAANKDAKLLVAEARIVALEEHVAALNGKNTELSSMCENLQAAVARNSEAHSEVERILTDKVLQLTAQVQYAMSWIEQMDAVGDLSQVNDQEEIVPEEVDRSTASSVARRLDMSGGTPSAKLPPSPPVEIHHEI